VDPVQKLESVRENAMTDMRGERVVVIGGTSGIGLAVARGSLAAGAQVIVASSRQSSVDAARAQLGDGVAGQTVDVLDPASLAALFRAEGPIDHLIYTAGEPLSMMRIDDLDLRRARSFFEIRYFGALNAISTAVPQLSPGGSITLTSGTAGERPGSGWALGSSVCGATNSLTRAMAVELAPIRVNAVAPGVTRSLTWSELSEDDRDDMYEQLGKVLPLGRVGAVEEVADAYLYCMNQRYATGTVLTIDGGTVLV
jgi:NAD(P)-dependent dehydrogenase (short-subunit alcohol dehydrogenase family)